MLIHSIVGLLTKYYALQLQPAFVVKINLRFLNDVKPCVDNKFLGCARVSALQEEYAVVRYLYI